MAIKNDETVELWALTGGPINTFDDCTDNINAIALAGNRIIYAARYNTAKLRYLNNGNLICTLIGHTETIAKIMVACNKIITQADDLTVKIWNFDGHVLYTFLSFGFYVEENTLILNYGNSDICINLNDGLRIGTLETSSAAAIMNGKIFTSCNDNTIKIFRLSDCKPLHTLPDVAPPATIYATQFIASENKIIAMPDYHTLKIYTDTRPGASAHAIMSAFATALHSRCGQHSPANILNSYLIQEISKFASPEPWAESPYPLDIRGITGKTRDNTYTCAVC